MATRTRNQLRALVRIQLDMDVIELPDTTLDPWLEDGFERSLAVENRWPFFEAEWTLTTVLNTVAYTKASIAVANAAVSIDQITDIWDITSLVTPYQLKGLPQDKARTIFGVGGAGGSVPAAWSEWALSVNVWPSPMAARTLRISGYRKPSWAVGDAVAPDCDERLHLCLYFFACAMAYAQQEDEVLSAEYLKHWQAALTQAHSKIMAPRPRRPVVMSGDACGWTNGLTP